jgi:cbb3-type cytochrome oxidase subunit 1
MDWYVKAFIKSALLWLGAGVLLGFAMTVRPELVAYRTAHLHMNLLGFVGGMIFGVGYHVLPRFVGHPLHSARLAGVHVVIGNLGLALLAAGFAWRVTAGFAVQWMLMLGGGLAAAGALSFAYNIWRTLDGRSVTRAIEEATQRRGLAVREHE